MWKKRRGARDMQLVVFEDARFVDLLPLAYPRATFNLRCGCDNLLSKIETAVGRQADALFVRPMLAEVMEERQRTQYAHPRAVNKSPEGEDQMWVNGRVLLRRMPALELGEAAWSGDTLVAARVKWGMSETLAWAMSPQAKEPRDFNDLRRVEVSEGDASVITYPWDLVHANETELRRQITAMPRRRDGNIHRGAHLVNESDIHVSEGTVVKPGTVLDAEPGPIFIGAGATIGPNATVIGPCYIGDKCLIRPGALIVGSSIGPVCKVGGEVEGTIIHAYSNKQHDGFLGHSYVGEWVNLGADTVNSDLKNTYGPVSVPINGRAIETGRQFVGAFIGDHSKTGIRTAMPTGCVIGYACSVFVGGYVPKFVPSFSWLTENGREEQDIEKMVGVARAVMARRGRELTAAEEGLVRQIHLSARDVEGGEKPKAKSPKPKTQSPKPKAQDPMPKVQTSRKTAARRIAGAKGRVSKRKPGRVTARRRRRGT